MLWQVPQTPDCSGTWLWWFFFLSAVRRKSWSLLTTLCSCLWQLLQSCPSLSDCTSDAVCFLPWCTEWQLKQVTVLITLLLIFTAFSNFILTGWIPFLTASSWVSAVWRWWQLVQSTSTFCSAVSQSKAVPSWSWW